MLHCVAARFNFFVFSLWDAVVGIQVWSGHGGEVYIWSCISSSTPSCGQSSDVDPWALVLWSSAYFFGLWMLLSVFFACHCYWSSARVQIGPHESISPADWLGFFFCGVLTDSAWVVARSLFLLSIKKNWMYIMENKIIERRKRKQTVSSTS